MDQQKMQQIEATLKSMMSQAQNQEAPVDRSPAQTANCNVIRRRKGAPEKRIL